MFSFHLRNFEYLSWVINYSLTYFTFSLGLIPAVEPPTPLLSTAGIEPTFSWAWNEKLKEIFIL